jgi:SAM-dependent methyltransferase
VGYVVDTTYADTFFRELSPAWLNYVAALNGVSPRPLDAAFRYLELGCGFGTSAVVNAAAFPHASFDACDFNVQHVDGGSAFAAQLGVGNIRFHATPFQDLLLADLAPYDFIALHGVYSWVDAATRDVLRRLVARLLLPGGLLYLSYNTLPGWSAELPLRKLMVELAATDAGTAAETSERAATTIAALSRAGLRYFSANPAATSAVEAYTRGEGHYLAHEFMNAAWQPFYGVDVAGDLSAIGLHLVGSATLANNHLALMLDAASAGAIATLASPRQQQLGIDFAVNQRFRRDVFVRGDVMPPRAEYLGAAVIGCMTDVEEIGVAARVPRGEIRFQEPFIRDVRTLFAGGSWPFGEAVEQLSRQGQDRAAISRNLLFLVANGGLAPFARRCENPAANPTRLANPMVERAIAAASSRAGRHVIPSDVAGNGVELDATAAVALLEWSRDVSGRPGLATQARELDDLASQAGGAADAFSPRLETLSRLGIVA